MLVYDCYICGKQYQFKEIKSLVIFNSIEYESEYDIQICPECVCVIKSLIDNLKNEGIDNA